MLKKFIAVALPLFMLNSFLVAKKLDEKKITENWQEIWNKNGDKKPEPTSTEDLLTINGYNSHPNAIITQKTHEEFVEYIRTMLALKDEDLLLEAGCGAGAMIIPMAQQGYQCWAMDYSEPLIEIGKAYAKNQLTVNETVVFQAADIRSLPYPNNMFNKIFSMGVFMYLGGQTETENALNELLRVSDDQAKILLLDLPDAEKREEDIQKRIELIGKERYEELYSELPHAYFEKEWFLNFAEKHDLACAVFDNTMEGYGNGQYRFNVLLEKLTPGEK